MHNEQEFIAAMVGEGLNPYSSEYAGCEPLEAAQRFARRMAHEENGAIVARLRSGTYIENQGHAHWASMDDITNDLRNHSRDALSVGAVAAETGDTVVDRFYAQERMYREQYGATDIIRTYYARFRVFQNGTVDVDLVDPELAPDQDKARVVVRQMDHAFANRSVTLSWQTYIQKLPERIARSMADRLRPRLLMELWPLFRPGPGGARTPRKGGRVEHGLSETQIIQFAQLSEELREKHGPGGSREAAARKLEVPKEYGGRSRADLLRRLESKGRKLREQRQDQTFKN